MSASKSALLLLAHGSPDSPQEIPEFMRYITGGRPVPDAVIEEVKHRYSLIGKSPLTEITKAQAEGVRRQLTVPVYLGMRNWRPFIADTVRDMMSGGVEHVVAICLAPHNSSTSTGLYRKALMADMKPEIQVQFVESWHDDPLLIQAYAEKLAPIWKQASEELSRLAPVIFTAHSVPMRTIQAGDPYEEQTRETARLVGETVPGLSKDLQQFAFQSQGMSGGPWLGPTVESAILEAKRQGHKGVVIAPIGFVCDHVEVLYDVDIGFKEFAAEQGMKLWRPESLNTSPTFISALAQLANSRLHATSGAVS
ncbi:MAG TPA: ferrochelatase [Candidatus Angelobacter sp.]|jgi:ferrochelatase|nr:ferrochelatase [Candidatus Angelobacter sp.]